MASLGKLRPIKLPIQIQHHPVVLAEQAQRASDIQLRIADWITGFAGSMNFVYIHIVLFTVWMLFIESKPWPTLTLIVSLQAVFLLTTCYNECMSVNVSVRLDDTLAERLRLRARAAGESLSDR